MRRRAWTVAACTALLCARAVLAAATPQQTCDAARIAAWQKYQSCMSDAVANDAKGRTTDFGQYAAFAKCRHKYFGRWARFQSYTDSTCVGARFTDNLDQTVTDNLTGLVWEKKTNLDGNINFADPHDADNNYFWSSAMPYEENGTAFTSFLEILNGGGGFAGANGWRLPTLSELSSILDDFDCKGVPLTPTCICPSNPCIAPALDPANTRTYIYWSATSYVPAPNNAWYVGFDGGVVPSPNATADKGGSGYVRAVRGGF